MERFCPWCGTVMLSFEQTRTGSSSNICSGCVEELEPLLAGVGLQLTATAAATNGG